MFELSADLIVQGVASALLVLVGLREFMKARRETIKATAPNPMVAAVSMAWDRDQQERLLQLVERMVVAQEAQTKHLAGIHDAQEEIADKRQADMQEKLDELLDRMKDMPAQPVRRR